MLSCTTSIPPISETNCYPFSREVQVVVNDLITEKWKRIQYRFPKSRKKRIRRKWAQNGKNYKSVKTYMAIKVGNTMFVHSSIYKKIKSQSKNGKN